MTSILRFVMVVAVIGIGSSVGEAQGTKIAPPKVGIVAKQPSDCDPQWACLLEGKVNDLAKRLDVAEKDNARLKGTIDQDEKASALKIGNLEGMIAVMQASMSVNNVNMKNSLDGLQSGSSFRLAALEATANEYKTHTHKLSLGWGFTKQGQFNMVTVNDKNVFSAPTSGPQH